MKNSKKEPEYVLDAALIPAALTIADELEVEGFEDWKPKHLAEEFKTLARALADMASENRRLKLALEDATGATEAPVKK